MSRNAEFYEGRTYVPRWARGHNFPDAGDTLVAHPTHAVMGFTEDGAAHGVLEGGHVQTTYPPHRVDKDGKPYTGVVPLEQSAYWNKLQKDPNFKETGDAPLFYERNHPGTVTELHASTNAKHLVPAVIGGLARHSLEKSGEVPQASTNLSQSSSRLVKNLKRLGLVQSDYSDFEVQNSVRPDSVDTKIENFGGVEPYKKDLFSHFDITYMHPDKVKASRDLVHSIMSNARKKEFSQGSEPAPEKKPYEGAPLPGMEHL